MFGASRMSWKDLICLCIVIMGVVFFIYGANYYDALIGWAGVCLVIAGFLVKIVLMVWENLQKKDNG
jgi:SNF family Na+-dependent transporter